MIARSARGPPPTAKKEGPSKTESDKAVLGEKLDEKDEPVKDGSDGEEPDTSDHFKKFMASLPSPPTVEEQRKNAEKKEEASKPTTEEQEFTAQKSLGGDFRL